MRSTAGRPAPRSSLVGKVSAKTLTPHFAVICAADGDFDFIICHGVYSWIPEALREDLLRVCRERLTPDGVAMVSAVGAGMISNPGVAARMFGALAANGINIELIATSEIKVSCVIRADDVERAVQALHAEFQLDRE